MPNWCNNNVNFIHADKSMIDRIENAEQLFSEFFPIPKDQEDNWYSYNIENFGTKWDVKPEIIERLNDNSIFLSFDSAWSPPIEFYNKMLELGFEIDATYIEEGLGFCGMYVNGDDNYLDYSDMSPDEIRDNYPEFDSEFNIAENMEMWMEDEDDEEN